MKRCNTSVFLRLSKKNPIFSVPAAIHEENARIECTSRHAKISAAKHGQRFFPAPTFVVASSAAPSLEAGSGFESNRAGALFK